MLLPSILAVLAVVLTALLLLVAWREPRRRAARRGSAGTPAVRGDDRPGLATEQIFFESVAAPVP